MNVIITAVQAEAVTEKKRKNENDLNNEHSGVGVDVGGCSDGGGDGDDDGSDDNLLPCNVDD